MRILVEVKGLLPRRNWPNMKLNSSRLQRIAGLRKSLISVKESNQLVTQERSAGSTMLKRKRRRRRRRKRVNRHQCSKSITICALQTQS